MRIISASLSPNTDSTDVWTAVRVLFTPWTWKTGSALSKVSDWFTNRFGSESVLFNSGRSAMLGILKAFDIGAGDEVLVQAFTCVAVPNSVLWAGATPIYVDIDERLNMDPKDMESKITKKTKAIVVQHTLGIPAQMDKIMLIAKKHNLLVIEDCAHALGASYRKKELGTWGDAAFFSFGRDKVVSSVFGGAAIIKPELGIMNNELRKYQEKLSNPSMFWILQQVLHPIAFSIIIPLYQVGIGKMILVAFQKLKLLSFPVYPEEKKGKQPKDFPMKYPNALAQLLIPQLAKFERLIKRRQDNARVYDQELTKKGYKTTTWIEGAGYLRFPFFTNDPDAMRAEARKHGVLLGNWYHNTIDPVGVDFTAIGYKPGSCPRAEEVAKMIVNLPTTIMEKERDAVLSDRIVK